MNSRTALQNLRLQRRKTQDELDRFIPNRSAMDFGYALYMLTEEARKKGSGKPDIVRSSSSEAYVKRLAEALKQNRTRILAFKNNPSTSYGDGDVMFQHETGSPQQSRPIKKMRHISQTPDLKLDAPHILDNYYMNLLDWGHNNVVAIALNHQIYLWDASNGCVSEFVTVNHEEGPVSSVSWAPDGRRIAVGLANSHVQLWDYQVQTKINTLRGGHQHGTQVNALGWNNHILTTGGVDAKIINNDVRVREHIVEYYRGHRLEVCGLKWSSSGKQLASGGNDNLLFIWDTSMASSSSRTPWLYRLQDHTSAVKALAWCPFQRNLLASGGGRSDRCIKFWNTQTGACLNSINTGSPVCTLQWNKHERELLSTHGLIDNQLILWKYPSMTKMAELYGHSSSVLYTAVSPNRYTVASAAGDETLQFWNVFGCPKVSKPVSKVKPEPFPHITRIR
ncbi:hypothetical protein PTKIN_Ptkin06aG0075400 [Pterospermum kingtungense]